MVRLTDITLEYRASGVPLRVLDLPSWHLEEGERRALAGRSGSGKTTLIYLISGLLLPTSGRVEVCGERVDTMSEKARDVFRGANIGIVFQSLNLLDPLNVIDNVLLGSYFGKGYVRQSDRERALELLERVGMLHRLTHRPRQLSMGERQRVALSRALMNKPKLLLADEPSAHLDAENGAIVVELMQTIAQEEDATLLMTSHDQAVLQRFDRIDYMEDGRPVPSDRAKSSSVHSAAAIGGATN